MPMSDCAALLAAIGGAPADDAPRLVFADWLDDHGQPERAEFIRVQVEMRRERLEHGRVTDRSDALFVRQRALFHQDWARPVREFGSRVIGEYSRGFSAGGFRLPGADFVRFAPALASWFGPDTVVTLVHEAGTFRGVAGRPELACVRSLAVHLTNSIDAPAVTADLADLFRSSHLGGVRALDFSHQNQTRRLAGFLCDAESLARLEHLDLEGNRLGTAGLLRLAANPRFAGLRVLDVRDTGATDRGVLALLDSPHLKSLTRLIVGGYGLTARFLGRLPPGRRAVLELVADD